jgi:hypothetical protein
MDGSSSSAEGDPKDEFLPFKISLSYLAREKK